MNKPIKTSNSTKHCRNKTKARKKQWFYDNKTMSWKYTKEVTDSVNLDS